MAIALAPQELAVVRSDGSVHFGDVLQVAHCGASRAVLAADTHGKDKRTGERSFVATAAPELTKPCARNTFVLAKYTAPKESVSSSHYSDDVLRYGQKIRVLVNPAVLGLPMDSAGGPSPHYLFSKPMSTTHHSKYTHHQVVGFTQIRNYDSVFKVVPTDPAQHIASEGVEVLAGVPLCIQHCSTHAMLCLEGAVHHNEFGSERELSCRVVHSNGRKLILCHEQAGKLTNTLPSHPAEANHFHFIVGTTVGQLPEPDVAKAIVDAAMVRICGALAKASLGWKGLQEKLLRMDMDGSGRVKLEEVQLAFAFVGIKISSAEGDALEARFGTTQPRVLNVRELLKHLRQASAEGI